MALFEIPSVRIDGIAACVPAHVRDARDVNHLMDEKQYAQFVKATGVERARKSLPGQTTSDLCFAAAERLLQEMAVAKDGIDLLVFVSQSPDYIIPMTSCLLQERLRLGNGCVAFDVTSGCSGYVQGLGIAASMISAGRMRRALLLSGDVGVSQLSANDKTTWPLFGDAGSATLLSFDPQASPIFFEQGTDGSGAEAIMIRDGGARYPATEGSLREVRIAEGVSRKNTQVAMNGEEVFSFAISEVPDSVERLYGHYGLRKEDTDCFVFHQANRMILETIASILGIPAEKVPMSLKDFGNTSSASIPLTIVTALGGVSKPSALCLCGFGVGLSWASCYFETGRIECPPLIEI